jgi:hypothetical protein
VLEMILIVAYVLGSLSATVYFLRSLAILIYSQRPEFAVQLEFLL